MYADRIREALTGAIDTRKLAEAWAALRPGVVSKATMTAGQRGAWQSGQLQLGSETSATPDSGTGPPALGVFVPAGSNPAAPRLPDLAAKAVSPILAEFLSRAYTAIRRALQAVLQRLWTEAWVLGQSSAEALTALQPVDWGAWTPGDYEAAEAIAGPGLRQLLDQAGITIQSIADSRLEELAAVLEATLASDVIHREPLPAPLEPSLSVGNLARQLRDVLDNPARAELVAHTEIARAQSEAARATYAETGRSEVEISTAEDAKVCPVCDAAEQLGAHPIGAPPLVPLHPRCRCAELPVLA